MHVATYQDVDRLESEIARLLRCNHSRSPAHTSTLSYMRFRSRLIGMKKLEAMESRVKAFFEEVASCMNEIECINLTLKGFQILGQGLQAFALDDNGENAKAQGGGGKGSDDGAGTCQ
jgi:hypothetical protein